ncbi:MAG: hypothetical protein IPI52_00705 [Bacteroidetes bacterium]|nr:hypothetical protein [Bacteroidota bacterium]
MRAYISCKANGLFRQSNSVVKHAVKDEDWVETIVVAEHENDLAAGV